MIRQRPSIERIIRYAGGCACILALQLIAGCNSLKLPSSLADRQEKIEKTDKDPLLAAPGKKSLRVSQFVFLSDFELQNDHPLFKELSDLREQVVKELHLPNANKVIQVYLFENRDRYERFMQAKYPDLPKRRAFFVAQPKTVGGAEDLMVFTFWGDRIQEDLRHELTHAILHSGLKDVPLWLDEGLAEFYELPPDKLGINPRHLEHIRQVSAVSFKPDLAHLEQLSQVQQMTPTEYREAWAWVHLMLRSRPEMKDVLIGYLNQLRTNPAPGALHTRLAALSTDLSKELSRHLDELDGERTPAADSQQ